MEWADISIWWFVLFVVVYLGGVFAAVLRYERPQSREEREAWDRYMMDICRADRLEVGNAG